MDFVSHVAHLVSLEKILLEIWKPRCGSQGDIQVFVALYSIGLTARCDVSRPLDEARYAHTALPGCALFAAERSGASVGPKHKFITVVGCIDDDRVVIDA